MNLTIFLFIPLAIYLINKLFIKKKFLLNYSGEIHQKFLGNKNIPLSGGIIILTYLLFIDFQNILFNFIFFIFFIIGIFSDTKFFQSPTKRFIVQSIILVIFVIINDIQISSTRIIFIDYFLNNFFFSIFFSYFCLIVLINGTNFIDGLNGLVLGYYILIIIFVIKLGFPIEGLSHELVIQNFIYLLFVLLIFNLANQLYLGDNGVYVLSLFMGLFLINLSNNNFEISPFFIILLLWYPCFENLFSIIRKFVIRKSPLKPDNKHLHHLLYYFVNKKFRSNPIWSNNISSIIINSYNLIIFSLGYKYYNNTQILIFIIIINILVYTIVYLRLFNLKYKVKY